MAKIKRPPLAICYDFDGTLAPGNMQERDFIPDVGTNTTDFWAEVSKEAKAHNADNILIYMWLMLQKAEAAKVPVTKEQFANFGKKVALFKGVEDWFDRINVYAKESGVDIVHYVISAGIREMIQGTGISKHFKQIYASSFCYDHHGVAKWPAVAMNYTTKTQFLFRINKGAEELWDHSKINTYIEPRSRKIPFSQMVFIGDGETDVPCFRLIKSQGGHSVAVYQPNKKGASTRATKLFDQGRISHFAQADYTEGKPLDTIIKAIIDKVAVDHELKSLSPRN